MSEGTESPRIAAVVTEYRPRSHADVIVGKYLRGFPTDDGFVEPRSRIVSLYMDQVAENDIGLAAAEAFGVPVSRSIVQALTLGTGELAVDGVLLIGEHGDYAFNEKEQHLYPRRHFMEQITGVFSTSGRAAPVFNDKHLSWRWQDALWMRDRAAELGAPFMAGSSLPVCWRDPFLEHELEAPLQEAVAVGFSGLDIYGFHTLEVLQCMAERRSGGETGVAAVTCLEGEAAWAHGRGEGAWWRELAGAACATVDESGRKESGEMEEHCENPALFLLEYRDGFRGAVVMLNGYLSELAYASRRSRRRGGGDLVQVPGPRRPGGRLRPLQLPGPQRGGDVPRRPAPVPGGAHPADQRRPGGGADLPLRGPRPPGDALARRGLPVLRPASLAAHRALAGGACLDPWPPEGSP